MADQWYYSRDTNKLGPFTSRELLDLATAGQIERTDMVWKEGIEQGVPAAKVKNLFPAAQVSAPAEAASAPPPSEPPPDPAVTAAPAARIPPSDILPNAMVPPEPAPAAKAAEPPTQPTRSPQQTAKKGRAVAIRGAIIISQDGQSVQFRKKCTQCGYADASKSRLPIKSGTTRASFYCPKCRKLRQVEIGGVY
jgi:hypothetical protein